MGELRRAGQRGGNPPPEKPLMYSTPSFSRALITASPPRISIPLPSRRYELMRFYAGGCGVSRKAGFVGLSRIEEITLILAFPRKGRRDSRSLLPGPVAPGDVGEVVAAADFVDGEDPAVEELHVPVDPGRLVLAKGFHRAQVELQT